MIDGKSGSCLVQSHKTHGEKSRWKAEPQDKSYRHLVELGGHTCIGFRAVRLRGASEKAVTTTSELISTLP